jgi:hypothetical protein
MTATGKNRNSEVITIDVAIIGLGRGLHDMASVLAATALAAARVSGGDGRGQARGHAARPPNHR